MSNKYLPERLPQEISDRELDILWGEVNVLKEQIMQEARRRLQLDLDNNVYAPEKIVMDKKKGRWKGKPKEPDAQEIIDEVKRK